MSVGVLDSENSVLLRDTSWQTYVQLRDADENFHVRMTYDRGDLEIIYYIKHEAVVRDREEVDLCIDPPPDLAIEIDVTSKSIDRLPIYAALGVPEVWQWREETLQVWWLNSTKVYAEIKTSQALRGFPLARMMELLKFRTCSDETTLIRKFQTWCRRRKKA